MFKRGEKRVCLLFFTFIVLVPFSCLKSMQDQDIGQNESELVKKLIKEFPNDCWGDIFRYLEVKDIFNLRLVSNFFQDMMDQRFLWSQICNTSSFSTFLKFYNKKVFDIALRNESFLSKLDGKEKLFYVAMKLDETKYVEFLKNSSRLNKLLSMLKTHGCKLECLSINYDGKVSADSRFWPRCKAHGCDKYDQVSCLEFGNKDDISNEELGLFKEVGKLIILNSKNFGGQGTKKIAWPNGIRHLEISSCPNFNCEFFKNLKKLRRLYVSENKEFNCDKFGNVAKNLITLYVRSCENFGKNQKLSKNLKNLQELLVKDCKNFNLDCLPKFPQLKKVTLYDYFPNKIPKKILQKLNESGCEIFCKK